MKRLVRRIEGRLLHSAGLPRFTSNFSRDSLLAALMSGDLELLREQVAFSAWRQADGADPLTGAEPGKIHHEVPGVGTRLGLATTYNACDTTALFLIAVELGVRCGRIGDWPRVFRPNIVAAGYLLGDDDLVKRADLKGALFFKPIFRYRVGTSPSGGLLCYAFGMKRIFKAIVLAIFGGLILYALLSPTPSSEELPAPKNLKEAVSAALAGTTGTYAMVIKNLRTGEVYSLKERQVFNPGSLYKIWVLAAALDQIEKGELEEDEVLSQDVSTLNRMFGVAPETAELKKGRVTLTVAQSLAQMITISHNYAALLLVERIGHSKIRSFLKENGFKEAILEDPPQTTANDLALFFEKLYRGVLVSRESSQRMLSLLKGQRLGAGIPKYLPRELEVAHKTGDIGWFKHDAGIVFSAKGDYVFVMLSESDYPAGAAERIAEVSKSVFDYFERI